ncbi:MAG: hypothetical protein WCX60_07975 [Anaerovoracaceae bacterium]
MAIQGSGLKWYPLYWVYHDQWRYYRPHPSGGDPSVWPHYGHMHFFMMGYNFNGPSADAFTGVQTYSFQLNKEWAPGSLDRNQQENYTIVGSPRWYFKITELWRRIYIQPWEVQDADAQSDIQRRGLKYDASDKIAGPYREGKHHSPYWAGYCRTLPVEYYTHPDKSQTYRDNRVKDLAEQLLPSDEFDAEEFGVDHSNYILYTHPAAKPAYSDRFYMWPIIEYQKVTQMDWQRLPEADEDGDGWQVSVTIPFINPTTGKYNSPFGQSPGQCDPAGIYHGHDLNSNPLVPESKRLKYAQVSYNEASPPHPVFQQPEELSGELIQFHDPYGVNDGKWVQQCLGGLVEAKALVRIKHRLGGEQDIWVNATQYVPTSPFEGRDQLSPAEPAS